MVIFMSHNHLLVEEKQHVVDSDQGGDQSVHGELVLVIHITGGETVLDLYDEVLEELLVNLVDLILLAELLLIVHYLLS